SEAFEEVDDKYTSALQGLHLNNHNEVALAADSEAFEEVDDKYTSALQGLHLNNHNEVALAADI
ncbi:hypothetical protein, partial [Streptomyces sp. NPDC096153]|uniref:hypothetical protein n=1 Tax=Streptomyces sp. NPDC096153 TaxID=3155548 RepID=UPI00331D46F6